MGSSLSPNGAAALGLSALLRASEVGYDALKIAGACYLMWLGVRSLRSILRRADEVVAEADALTAPPKPGRSGFAAGFLTDILNPKVGVFFVSFPPGFVPGGYAVGWTTLALGALYSVLTALYFAGLIAVSGAVATG